MFNKIQKITAKAESHFLVFCVIDFFNRPQIVIRTIFFLQHVHKKPTIVALVKVCAAKFALLDLPAFASWLTKYLLLECTAKKSSRYT